MTLDKGEHPRPADWRPGLEVTGYWWPADPGDWTPPAELTSFLSDGPAPVFVGYGSTMTTPARAKQLPDIVRHTAKRAGVRVIVQAGSTNLDVADETVMTIGDTPHDWLFPSCRRSASQRRGNHRSGTARRRPHHHLAGLR